MFETRSAQCRVPLSLTTALFLAFCSLWASEVRAQENAAKDKIALKIEPPFAWNRTDQYEAPDYEAFFPDDSEAGKSLDQMLAGKLKVAGIDRRLALIRRGLRNSTRHRTTLLGTVGNQYIWNRDQQDPRAIELMYHASASDDGGVAHYAMYHGPTVVSERTPNLVRMLMDRYQSLDKQMQDRIAWGMKTYGNKEHTRKLLLDLLEDHKNLSAETVGATLETYQAVFDAPPPDMGRFDDVGLWVIAWHRTDLSASHPRAAEILRENLDKVLRTREQRVVDFVTRVDAGHETAVALIQGVGPRDIVATAFSKWTAPVIDFNEMLSPRVLQARRLREFAKHLPNGLPEHAKPAYTRPPVDASYAHEAAEFVAPDFEKFFTEDAKAGAKLDEVYENRETIELSDRELLDLFRRGVRRSTHSPNLMFGWILGSLGWPRDPLLTEIFYQAVDPKAPPEMYKAGIYYGFGLGTQKTKNILEAMYQVYMSPPFDRTTNGNMRSRILWGVRDHEDDKHYLATRFEEALRNHATLSYEAIEQADGAYRCLTERAPPNAADYASRGVYLVIFDDADSSSIDASKQWITPRLDKMEHVIDSKYVENNGRVTFMAVVHGTVGMHRLVEILKPKPRTAFSFAGLLTPELIAEVKNDVLRDFEKHLPTQE
jgi:hypothetical protein